MNKLIGLTIILLLVIFLFMYANAQKPGLFFGINQKVAASSGHQKDTLITDVIPLTIQHQMLSSDPKFTQIKNGHMVVLQITSDEDGDFYLEGYDKHLVLHKGKMVVLSFLSTINGHFVYQLANIHKVLGTLTVTP